MKQYHKLLEDILEHGEEVNDRTGVGTKSIFGYQMRFDLRDGFPAVTTKRLAWKAVVGELAWFLEGSTDERRLAELTHAKDRADLVGRNTIWTANADNQGKALGYYNNDQRKMLGPIYGYQWRNFGGDYREDVQPGESGFDQIKWLLNEIRTNPESRRLILSAWNPTVLDRMALPPCHFALQFKIINGKLNCMLTQRSGDSFLGIPFNIASYSLLTHIIARECNLEVGNFVHSIGDAHIYLNHIDQVKEQLSRKEYPLPILEIDNSFNLTDRLEHGFKIDDVNAFKLKNYLHHPVIKAPMAV